MAKIVDKEQKRAGILQAAMEVFAEKGVARSKMADIARAAGIGKGTIYEYFSSKEEIFASAFQLINSEIDRAIPRTLEGVDDPVEKLRRLIEVTMTGFTEWGEEFLEIMMDFWAEGVRKREEGMMSLIDLKGMYARYRGMIGQILNEGIQRGIFREVDVLLTASILMASLDGLMLQWVLDKSLFDFREAIEVSLDSFLNGIRK